VTAPAVPRLKIRPLSISPMIRRRVLVAGIMALRELHGVLQVVMSRESPPLFVFERRGARFGSWRLSAASPDVTPRLAPARLGRHPT
jgi:hypothetical protein